MRVLITGGTGALARELLSAAFTLDIALRLSSRRPPAENAPHHEWIGADLTTGAGLPDALRDVTTIVHTASDFSRSHQVDVEGTKRLLDASRRAGVAHLIYVSIVGIDRIPYRYYQHKLAAEQLIERGPVPFTILRATQFHSFIDSLLTTAARCPLVMPLPVRFQVQPVATRDVARRLVQAILDGPRQHAPDFGGPETLSLADVAREWKAATGIGKPVLPIFLPGRVAAAFRAGRNTVQRGVRGTLTWREWLSQRYPTIRA